MYPILERQPYHQGETVFAFAKRPDRLTLVLVDDGIQLPVADTPSPGDDGRTTLLYPGVRLAIWVALPRITTARTAVMQMQIQTPALAPVLADMADAGYALRLQTEADLHPDSSPDADSTPPFASMMTGYGFCPGDASGFVARPVRDDSAILTVAQQFTGDGGAMHAEQTGNGCLALPAIQGEWKSGIVVSG